ncbi:hypothetical protein Asppvi_011062 [Aspergillus pseudoviridinutans]|uniref:RRM domain-containing protein n=1 Tax=Aspergillus pseudoviridinutans TaxID=1517512 RepID=A0A9P3BIU9_9EURO|nr:uncharacterized protein Asppvi_011062 [Aspergillus pseudoviridinutans]GIJ92087.1 hypothetical protein Asppvi_011062 [Aspergillus pseudoviridinutans]
MTQISDGKSTGGVLQIPVAATQKNASTASKKAPKPPAPRLKLLVRRLPPGLTQSEFENALGSEWMVGAGKVDWYQYKPGKVSKDHAKPSRPSRAYIHVTSSEHIAPLSDVVRQTSFLDARNTFNDSVLLGPPSLEFSPYAKIPGSRVRKDARQGTIDQDPEFIAFLESLTQPITKPTTVETPTDAEEKKETVTTTPLVQYIKEKKANKAKEASSKSSRHAKGDKESKSEKVQAKKLLQRPDKDVAVASTGDKAEKKSRTSDKATKDAVKAANRAANAAAKQAGKSATQNTSRDSPQAAPTERKRERNNVAAAAKILQRDLGLAPSGGRRRAGKGAATETDSSKKEPDAVATPDSGKKDIKSGKPASPSQQGTLKSKANATPPSGDPASSRAQSGANAAPTSTPSAPKQSKTAKGKPAAPVASPTATQAFLKHANPSQGVTEPLLETAFAPFGKILKVEIDKKKGFGYVDFAEPEGLQKAIAASPVTVAQSQVVVLERKVNPGAEKARGKGRSEQPAPNNGSSGNGNRGARQGSEGGSGPGTPSSSRGPRGGRGSRNKGGSKSKEANASSNTPSGKTGGEAK